MNITKALKAMKEIKAANEKHLQEWKQRNMKIWVADYGFIDQDGNKHCDDTKNFPYGTSQIQVEATDLQSALDEAKKQLLAMSGNRNWQEVKIWNIGICNDNIW